MSTLKELTWDHHERAETSRFASILMSGEITPYQYQQYLFNQMICYGALEDAVDLPEEFHRVFRANEIYEDLHEIQREHNLPPIEQALQTTVEYVNYIEQIRDDNHKLLAHLYVRHFGDLHGGQMIKKKVPGSGKMYEFAERYELIKGIRELLDDSMADEARTCFEFAFHSFEELSENVVD